VGRVNGLDVGTLGADKGYDAGGFLLSLRERYIDAHVACKAQKEIEPDDPGSWERWFNQQEHDEAGYAVSQRKRKLVEEVFGWLKVVGGMRRVRVTGRKKIQQLADIALTTLNMVRMSKLLAT